MSSSLEPKNALLGSHQVPALRNQNASDGKHVMIAIETVIAEMRIQRILQDAIGAMLLESFHASQQVAAPLRP